MTERRPLLIVGGKVYAVGPRPIDTRPIDVQVKESVEKINRLIADLKKMGEPERRKPQLKLIKREE